MSALRGENYAHWRILSCYFPHVVFHRWDLCPMKDIKLLLSSGGLSEVRIMHTEGYWTFIVLRWSLRGEKYDTEGYWLFIEMLLYLGGLSKVINWHTEGYWDVIILRWSFRGENYEHWRILRYCCLQVVFQPGIEMSLPSGGLSHVRIMSTEGYWAAIVLRWSRGSGRCHFVNL